MRMGQGVRTGLGHGGITCVLQTQFSSFFFFFFFVFCFCVFVFCINLNLLIHRIQLTLIIALSAKISNAATLHFIIILL